MKHVFSTSVLVAASTLAAAAIVVVGAMFMRRKKVQKYQEVQLKDVDVPKKWKKVGEVSALTMYPLKGGKRRCLDEAEFTARGISQVQTESSKLVLRDRVFVVYNEKNEFINGKKSTKMLLVETTPVDESRVRFSYPEVKDLVVDIPENNVNLDQIKFWFGESVKTVDCGEEAAQWFSQTITGKSWGLRLGCFVSPVVPDRTIDGAYDTVIPAYTKVHSDYLGLYADVASYMLLSEESVKDLNTRLDRPVTPHHFRPNLVVSGSPAYSEDTWDWVKIGDNVLLRGFKHCTRCVVTTMDPDTAQKDPAVEPLKTMRTYRQVLDPKLKKVEGDTPVMGLYAGCHWPGIVRVGDPIYINTE